MWIYLYIIKIFIAPLPGEAEEKGAVHERQLSKFHGGIHTTQLCF